MPEQTSAFNFQALQFISVFQIITKKNQFFFFLHSKLILVHNRAEIYICHANENNGEREREKKMNRILISTRSVDTLCSRRNHK